GYVASRGKAQGLALLEAFVGLAPADYADPERLRAVWQRPHLRQLEVNNRAALLLVLADKLSLAEGRGSGQGLSLLEAFLGLGPADYTDPDRLRAIWRRPHLAQLEANNRANLVQVLTNTLGLVAPQGGGQGLALLEAFLGLAPADYADP